MQRLEMGPAIRIVLRFKDRFWESISKPATDNGHNLFDMGFIHDRSALIPTWWTVTPLRSPILVGWAAGPNVDRLDLSTESGLQDQAIKCLASLFNVPTEQIKDRIEGLYSHNWQSDPFARGAYSYALVGGFNARHILAAPEADTLFFAGEATNHEGHSGTVHGAVDTGRRAAQEILKAI